MCSGSGRTGQRCNRRKCGLGGGGSKKRTGGFWSPAAELDGDSHGGIGGCPKLFCGCGDEFSTGLAEQRLGEQRWVVA